MINRHLLLWSPFQRKSINVGIEKVDGTITNEHKNKAFELQRDWSNVFGKKNINRKLANILADNFYVPTDFRSTRFPSVDDIINFLKQAKHSAPGLDGIPYRCWLAVGRQGAPASHRILVTLCN